MDKNVTYEKIGIAEAQQAQVELSVTNSQAKGNLPEPHEAHEVQVKGWQMGSASVSAWFILSGKCYRSSAKVKQR